MRIVFLGSGSSGNATLVVHEETKLLVDCGFSAKETARRLELAGVDADEIQAILVTHEHTDHVCGVETFASRHGVGVYATERTALAAGYSVAWPEPVVPGEIVRIGQVDVLPFQTSHDAADPVSYVFEAGGVRIGLASDLGCLTRDVLESLACCDVLGIESNHDLAMLHRGPYPPFLKKRILSDRGHLSNRDAAEALQWLASSRLCHLFALHVSRTNNLPVLAEESLACRLAELGVSVPVKVVEQDAVCSLEVVAA